MFWSGTDDDEDQLEARSFILSDHFEFEGDDELVSRDQEEFYEKQLNRKWDQGETFEGDYV